MHFLAFFQIMPVDLGPGDAFVRSMLGGQRNPMNLQRFEHFGSRRRAARKALDEKATVPAVSLRKLETQPAELGRKGVMDEKNVHRRYSLPLTSNENFSASRGRHTSWENRSCTSLAAASPSGR